jgi:hypothetical protein
MTDLRDLLDTAAGEPGSPTPDVVSADLRRGRMALRRRRGVRASSGLVLAAAAVAVGVAVVPNLGGDPTGRTVVTPGATSANPGVDLVPWSPGDSPMAISPGLVPDGWTIEGSRSALVISAPAAVTSSVDDFEGKLVAMLAGDTTQAPGAATVPFGSSTATLSKEAGTTTLLFSLPDGRLMDVQAPSSLHWDTATLVEFAQAVTVSADATAGVG